MDRSLLFEKILSVLYKDGLCRFVEELLGGIVVRDLERGLTLDIALYQVLFDCIFVWLPFYEFIINS